MKLDRLKNILSNRFAQNTGWIMFERIFQMAISLIVGMLVARYLGPTNYGIINYVAAFISFAIPVCSLGFEGLLVKKYIDRPNDVGRIIGTTIILEFLASIACTVFICLIVGFSNASDELKILIAFLESVRLLFKSTEPIEFWFQSQLKSKVTSIIRMLGYVIMSAYRIILLIMGKSVVWFAFATSLDMIVIAIFYCLAYRKYCGIVLRVDFSFGWQMLKESYHFIISGLMVVIYSQMDKVMIQSMLGDFSVGLYSASYMICNLWFFIPGALITSAQPLIMQKKNINESAYIESLKILYASIFWLGILVGFTVSIFSKYIILLLYGKAFLGASMSLTIGIWYGTFAQLGNARGIWILCENKNKYVKYYLAWGTFINLILNYVLIPRVGINGAAIATLVTQFMVSFIVPLFYSETRIHTKILVSAVCTNWIKRLRKG